MAGEDADATAWAMGDDGVARLYADAEALAAGTPLECSVPAYDDFVLDYFSVVNRCLSGPLRSFAHKVRLRRREEDEEGKRARALGGERAAVLDMSS
jgi:hypothetical protein